MTDKLMYRVKKEDVALRIMFSDAIIEENFLKSVKKNPELFHETLSLACDRNWIHPVVLAKKLNENGTDVSESNTRKWFKQAVKDRVTPNSVMMTEVFKAASEILKNSVKNIQTELERETQKDQTAPVEHAQYG